MLEKHQEKLKAEHKAAKKAAKEARKRAREAGGKGGENLEGKKKLEWRHFDRERDLGIKPIGGGEKGCGMEI